ncbi:class I SAM-dependent methyltransferase [Glycomyces tenuis]|uniref:class I SAM-dependent methyltransferase n=1 Tax=Glycomyces tenuis TaxID=58116 RepID=UPI00041DED79|nr:class I SAM-dependent methyltransferase [Glycomyces tenuis]
MNLSKRTAVIATATCAAAMAGGYALGGANLAAYALLSSVLTLAVAKLWRQIDRAQREQTAARAAIEERIATLSKRVSQVRKDQETGLRELSAQVDRTRNRIRQVPADTRRLMAEDDRTGELVRRLDDVAGKVEDLPKQTRLLVREWSRIVYSELEDLTALYRDIEPDRALPELHGWATGADLARFIYQQVAVHGRSNVLECGSGSTTVVLAYAMRARGGGRVTSLEHEPRFAEATRAMLRERGLGEWAEVVDAPLTDVKLGEDVCRWYDTAHLPDGPIDLLLVDGPPASVGPGARYPALPLLADRLSEDATVLLDDTRRPDERAIGERWASEFGEFELTSLPHDHGTMLLTRRTRPSGT